MVFDLSVLFSTPIGVFSKIERREFKVIFIFKENIQTFMY